ncbi:unnamed protein product [Phytomonas sp. Hart1]|nr:unnamed protein product [Phytomonas sp. Hart1]|eukprot:CCW69189.1 unnamed protein product [Phytomonas sp. isolate Hart1]
MLWFPSRSGWLADIFIVHYLILSHRIGRISYCSVETHNPSILLFNYTTLLIEKEMRDDSFF